MLERGRLSGAARVALGVGAAGFAALLSLRPAGRAGTPGGDTAFGLLLPTLLWAALLAGVAAVGGLAWTAGTTRWPGLAGRGGVVLLTAVLVAGAPGLVMDAAAARTYPNGGAYAVERTPDGRG